MTAQLHLSRAGIPLLLIMSAAWDGAKLHTVRQKGTKRKGKVIPLHARCCPEGG